MGRGIAFSFALHTGIVLILFAFASLGTKPKINFDDVVKVTLASLPAKPEPTPIAQPAPAQATPQIPVEPPKPTAKKVVTEKPKPKKEKAKPTKKETPKENVEAKTEAVIDSITTGENANFKGATVDNPNFNYGWWFSQAFYKIYSNWRNTVQYDGKLVCTISFQVIKSGRVFDLKVIESSGIPEFDNSCTSAVELSSPFPPLPRDFPDEVIGITIPMTNN